MDQTGQKNPAPVQGPLDGIRVLDLSWWFAAPQGTRILAAWGASIFKVEWPPNPDALRFMVPAPEEIVADATSDPELSGFYNDANCNKYGITLNMNSEQGRAIFRELLTKVDVVLQNYVPSVMKKWGLDYETMAAINPRIIYLAVSGYGQTGRSRDYPLWGGGAQALTGLTHASGLPGVEPAGWGFSYMDHVPGFAGAIYLLMALYHREVTGKGQYLDLSQTEAGMALTGAALLDYTVNGRGSRRPGFPPGNRASWPGSPVTSSYRSDPVGAPHNSYRCAGDDYNAWCVIAAGTEAHWQALCAAMGDPEWAQAPRFASLAERLGHQEELDRHVEAWTRQHDKYLVMEKLQAAGVPCGAVQSNQDRVETDPHLRARNAHKEIDHPILGRRLCQQIPVKMSETPQALSRSSPRHGEHNEAVYGELLGYTPAQVQALVDEGVLWPSGLPRPPWVRGQSHASASD